MYIIHCILIHINTVQKKSRHSGRFLVIDELVCRPFGGTACRLEERSGCVSGMS